MILCVDPGINVCGCALFDSVGNLHRAWLARSLLSPQAQIVARCAEMATRVVRGLSIDEMAKLTVFIGEWPQFYSRAKSKGDPNVSILPLAGVIAAVAAQLPQVTHVHYKPRDWKGTADGDKFTSVIIRHMRLGEHAVVEACPESLRHNVFDAVGIGLKYLGRLEKRRVISRGAPR